MRNTKQTETIQRMNTKMSVGCPIRHVDTANPPL